jgi:hypothetical protein
MKLQLPIEDLAYIASIIDGEGSIFCVYDNKCPFKPFRFRVSVGMTDQGIINWLYETTKLGYVCDNSSHKKNKKHKVAYQWKLNLNDGAILLSNILPYLKIKKHQAEAFLYYYNDQEVNVYIGERLRDLNRRGVEDYT